MKKAIFVSSSGGHYSELMQLSEVMEEFNTYIVTEKTLATKSANVDSYLIYGTRSDKLKYPFTFLLNSLKSLYIILKVRPDYIISTGAHSCVSFFYLAPRAKKIYIESYAKVNTPSLTYKLIKNKCDLVIVQHEEMLGVYPEAKFLGGVY